MTQQRRTRFCRRNTYAYSRSCCQNCSSVKLGILPGMTPPEMTELPEDWFVEDADALMRSLAPLRPKGVTVCAFIFWLSAVTFATTGGITIVKDPASGTWAFVLSGLTFAGGYGLWHLRPWARKLSLVLCWTIAALLTADIVSTAITVLRGRTITDPGLMFFLVGSVIWNVLWALYLGTGSTRKSFDSRSR